MKAITWQLGYLGDVTLTVTDERVPAIAEALEELGFEDARIEGVHE